MTTKIKTILLTAIFVFGLLTGLQAQEKYEFAIVSFYGYDMTIEISIDGKDFKSIKVPKTEKMGWRDANPVLKEIKNMNNEGWEIFNTGITSGSTADNVNYTFFLKRRRN